MPFEIPLFPLNVVLFPGMHLPLHVFEPRYRLMIGRCLEEDQTFGVALIMEGEEGQPGTLPADVGCTAEITEVVRLPDGRMNLHTTGRRRFRVLSLREEDEYLIGTVEWLDDETTSDNAADLNATDLARQTRHALRNYLTAVASGLSTALGDYEIPDDPYALSTWVAALMELPAHQKQELLEMTSTSARLERELQLLRRATIVQHAFTRRADWPPSDLVLEDPTASYAKFLSLN